MGVRLSWVSLVWVMVCASDGIGQASAQTADPAYPTTLTGPIWVWPASFKPPTDSMFQFYADGVLITALRSGGSEELGVAPTVTFGRRKWFVRYPDAPALDPHELCVYKASKEDATCAPFHLKPDRMLWERGHGGTVLMRANRGDANLARAFLDFWVKETTPTRK